MNRCPRCGSSGGWERSTRRHGPTGPGGSGVVVRTIVCRNCGLTKRRRVVPAPLLALGIVAGMFFVSCLTHAADMPAVGPTLKIDPEIHPSGQYARVLPDTDCISVVYVGLDGVDPIPSDILKDGRLFLLDCRGLAIGRYRFAAVGASKAGEEVRADFTVVVGTPPPGPTPPGPGPTDPFAAAVADAYKGDSDPGHTYASALQGVYLLMPAAAADPNVKTWGDLVAVLNAKRVGVIPDAALPKTRKVISDELGKVFGTDGVKPIDRALAAGEFQKVAAVLGGLK